MAKIRLDELGVKFVKRDWYGNELLVVRGHSAKVFESSDVGIKLIKEIAKEANTRSRSLDIYYTNEEKIIGVGFHIENDPNQVAGDGDYFIDGKGHLSSFRELHNEGLNIYELEDVKWSLFNKAIKHFLRFGSGHDEFENRSRDLEASRLLKKIGRQKER